MKNVIVFSIWGDNQIYWKGAVSNIKLAKKYYPDFICRFYIDENSNKNLIDTIKGDNVEIILLKSFRLESNIEDRFNHSGIFWRFLALSDNNINILLSRDCDSRISQREVNAVNEWLKSDKDFHIMKDHPYHIQPILTGLWGARNNILSNINELLLKWKSFIGKGLYQAEDQDFLGQIVYPLIKENSIEHSQSNELHVKEFPSNRVNYEFVGDVFDENELRHPHFFQVIKN